MSINDTIPSQVGHFTAMLAAGPVIIEERDGVLKVLLVKHGNKSVGELKWKFPGGKTIKGENFRENAFREAFQEIGVEVTLLESICPMVLWNEVPETGGGIVPESIVLIHFLASISDEPVMGDEVLAMDWVAIDALPSDVSPNVADVIAEYKYRRAREVEK
jgi:ADP-ribose pyrophosphatase YjhB (NUDIX family)